VRCSHLHTVRDVVPSARGCGECLTIGSPWVHLRLCRTCGHVGCCDDSPHKHATSHFHATGHPIIEGYDPPEGWGWCYMDEVLFDLSRSRDAATWADPSLRVTSEHSLFRGRINCVDVVGRAPSMISTRGRLSQRFNSRRLRVEGAPIALARMIATQGKHDHSTNNFCDVICERLSAQNVTIDEQRPLSVLHANMACLIPWVSRRRLALE
jgi:hypothetical protein